MLISQFKTLNVKHWKEKQNENIIAVLDIKDRLLKKSLLPSEGGSIGRVIGVGDGESEQDVSVWFVLLDVDRVVPLGKDGRVVVDVLDVDVQQNAGRQSGSSLVFGLDFQHWKINFN